MQALFFIGQSETSLEWREAQAPVIEHPQDALVRPLAIAACDLDKAIVSGQSPFPGPFMLGHEFTGEIVEIGEAVSGVAVGDRVLASFQPSCGTCQRCGHAHSSVCETVPNGTMYGIGAVGGNWGGAITDLIRVPWAEYNLAKVSATANVNAIASAADNLADGLRGVDRPLADKPGASVLIAGRGSIPLYATLCAQFLGAGEVTVASDDEFVLSATAGV